MDQPSSHLPSSHLISLRAATQQIVSVLHDALKAEMLAAASVMAGVEVVDAFTCDPDGHQPVLHTWNDRIVAVDDFFPDAIDEPDAQAAYNQAWFVADAIHTVEQLADTIRALQPTPAPDLVSLS